MSDKAIVLKSKCPFCVTEEVISQQFGRCQCGAIYAISPSPRQSIMILAEMQGQNPYPVSVRYDGIVNFYRMEKLVCNLSPAEVEAICSDADFPVFLESDFM